MTRVLPCMRDWVESTILAPQREALRQTHEKYDRDVKRDPKPRLPMTADEMVAIQMLARCRFLPGCTAKRFARDMQGVLELTKGQTDYLWLLVHRYRKQIHQSALDALERHNTGCERTGVEAVDWRPESTVSEDYYTL